MYKDTEFILLLKLKKILTKNPAAKQRDIAKICSISLGSVSKVLRCFENRGWIIINRITSRQTMYSLTESGLTAGNEYLLSLIKK
jgi:DNA-binding MarR family transcriptional regulator